MSANNIIVVKSLVGGAGGNGKINGRRLWSAATTFHAFILWHYNNNNKTSCFSFYCEERVKTLPDRCVFRVVGIRIKMRNRQKKKNTYIPILDILRSEMRLNYDISIRRRESNRFLYNGLQNALIIQLKRYIYN